MSEIKQDIIKAGESLFAKQGFEQTSMREIAEEVGVSKANLYHHFSNKKGLLKTIIESAFEGYKNQIDAIVDEDKQTQDQLKSAIISYLEVCSSHKQLVQLLSREDIKRNENVKHLISDIEKRVRNLWKNMLHEIDLDDEYDIDIIVELFMAMVDTFVIKKYVLETEKMNISHEKLAHHIAYLFFE